MSKELREKIAAICKEWWTSPAGDVGNNETINKLYALLAPPAPAQATEKGTEGAPYVCHCGSKLCRCIMENDAAALKAPKVAEESVAIELIREYQARIAAMERQGAELEAKLEAAHTVYAVHGCAGEGACHVCRAYADKPTPAQASKADGSPLPAEQAKQNDAKMFLETMGEFAKKCKPILENYGARPKPEAEGKEWATCSRCNEFRPMSGLAWTSMCQCGGERVLHLSGTVVNQPATREWVRGWVRGEMMALVTAINQAPGNTLRSHIQSVFGRATCTDTTG